MFRAQVGVPVQFQDELEAVHFETGCPRSWIAAVCERTGWNPNYNKNNVEDGTLTVRQFGIAGVWARIPEITLQVEGGTVKAGWFPPTNPFCRHGCVVGGACLNKLETWDTPDDYRSVRRNMTLAARILLNSAQVIETLCGEVSNLAFLRWQWGCHYTPVDPITGDPVCDTFPPGIPNVFIDEVDHLVETQALYAEIFGEPVIGAAPLSVSLSAVQLVVPPGSLLTFTANAAGGSPPYTYLWSWGDGLTDESAAHQFAHAYESVGTYQVQVRVTDNIGGVALSPTLTISVEEGAEPPPPPPGGIGTPLLLGLLGLLGLVGLAAFAGKKDKRKLAQDKRQKAAQLRAKATQERLKGNESGARQLETEAQRLEQEAGRLEQEAAREEAVKYQLRERR